MRELRIRNLPEDLFDVLEAMAKRDRVSTRVAAIMLLRVGQTVDTMRGQTADNVRTKRGRFVPPEESVAAAHYRAKGYHFNFVEFMAHYGRQGWKLGNGRAMTSWEQTMVTWESKWKEGHKGQGAPPDAVAIKRAQEAAARARGEID